MPEHHEHAGHGHGARGHTAHGPVAHAPPPDALAAHRRASEEAQPEPGRGVVSVDLEARASDWEIAPGRTLPGWTYNGQVPGPTIEAHVGDVLVVRLKNSLAEPTTIHWHGLPLPAAMDGTENVQHAVPPGETFEYRFMLPDAGTFWYHPHSNETVQLERGLYGALVVRGPDEPTVDRERVLVLDDLTLDRKGEFAKFGGLMQRHDGREGDTRLVNGRVEPELTMTAGHVERWRVVNAASARYVRLSIGKRPFRILGTDGGFIEAPVTVDEVLLPPGDRIDIAVGPFEEGATIAVDSLPYKRLHGTSKLGRFATIRVGAKAVASVANIPARLRTIEPLVRGDATPNREVRFQAKLSLRRGVDWLVNEEAHHGAPPVTVGELQVWDIVNETFIDHPFHLHGFFFQVLEADGEPPPYLSWEDTYNVPGKSRIRIAWMPDDRPGSWMYHCHILEHHEAGMMAHFDVVRPGEEGRKAPPGGHAGHHHH